MATYPDGLSIDNKHRSNSMRPVVEFFPLQYAESKQGKKYELFGTGPEAPSYNNGLREALESMIGVYIFFDSRGCPIYIGKASEQKL